MYMTWSVIAAGVFVVFILPITVITLNRKKYPWGWIVLAAFIAFMVVGNIVESATN
jgi:hypothetical protein